jgi:ribonuclease HI
MEQAESKLRQLCSAVLRGHHARARELALHFSAPRPRGSSIVRGWFDGACWPNPGGHCGYGALVKRHDVPILSKAVYMGHGAHLSHEIAEYAGAIEVLRFLLSAGIGSATVYGDSRMVIQQLNGLISPRHGAYVRHYHEARALRVQLPSVRLVWISRGLNTEADALSRQPLRTFLPG